MKVMDLNEKINQLATRKAAAHVRRMIYAVREVFKTTGHGKREGDGTWFGTTMKAVLSEFVRTMGSTNYDEPRSEELEAYYRSEILNEVLEKLPLVKELAMMEGGDDSR